MDRAVAADPRAFGSLPSLAVERVNRLGIVDLILPDGTPTGWCRRLYATGLVRYAEVARRVFSHRRDGPAYTIHLTHLALGENAGSAGEAGFLSTGHYLSRKLTHEALLNAAVAN